MWRGGVVNPSLFTPNRMLIHTDYASRVIIAHFALLSGLRPGYPVARIASSDTATATVHGVAGGRREGLLVQCSWCEVVADLHRVCLLSFCTTRLWGRDCAHLCALCWALTSRARNSTAFSVFCTSISHCSSVCVWVSDIFRAMTTHFH